MSGVTDLGAARFGRGYRPSQHKPRDVLAAMLKDIDEGNLDPTHVIVCYAVEDDTDGSCGFYQGGKLPFLGQLGMLSRISYFMNE